MDDLKRSQLLIARIARFERLSKNHDLRDFARLMNTVDGNELAGIFSEHNPLLRLAGLTGNSDNLRDPLPGTRHDMLKRQTARRCRDLKLRNRHMPCLIGDNLAIALSVFPSYALTRIDREVHYSSRRNVRFRRFRIFKAGALPVALRNKP